MQPHSSAPRPSSVPLHIFRHECDYIATVLCVTYTDRIAFRVIHLEKKVFLQQEYLPCKLLEIPRQERIGRRVYQKLLYQGTQSCTDLKKLPNGFIRVFVVMCFFFLLVSCLRAIMQCH